MERFSGLISLNPLSEEVMAKIGVGIATVLEGKGQAGMWGSREGGVGQHGPLHRCAQCLAGTPSAAALRWALLLWEGILF